MRPTTILSQAGVTLDAGTRHRHGQRIESKSGKLNDRKTTLTSHIDDEMGLDLPEIGPSWLHG